MLINYMHFIEALMFLTLRYVFTYFIDLKYENGYLTLFVIIYHLFYTYVLNNVLFKLLLAMKLISSKNIFLLYLKRAQWY